MSKARQLADLGNVYDDGALSNRNLIINGAMQVAQRGTSSSSIGFQTVDRFRVGTNSTDELAFIQSQDTDAPNGFTKSFKVAVTTPETSWTTGEWFTVRYTIEGQDAQLLQFGQSTAQKTTLSFWVKSSVTGDYAVMFFNSQGSSRGQSFTYTITSANTWEYKTIVFDGDTAQSFSDSNAAGPDFYFTLSSGPDRQTTDGSSWQNYSQGMSAYGQTADVGGTASATWQITGVQLEVGDTATPFEHRSYGDELARCQRYYYELGGVSYYPYFLAAVMNSALVRCVHQHPVPMRASPALSTTNPTSIDVEGNSVTSLTIDVMTTITAMLNINVSTSFAVRDCVRVYNNVSGISKIHFDAEL